MICKKCGQDKPINDYYKANGKKLYVCKSCIYKRNREWVLRNYAHNSKYQHNWYKDKIKDKNYKEKVYAKKKKLYDKKPWLKTYKGIISRCGKHQAYKDIKNYLTPDNLKFLWLRDKAYLMKKPSIDRIDTTGDYIFQNCRYIEYLENLNRPKRKPNWIKRKVKKCNVNMVD